MVKKKLLFIINVDLGWVRVPIPILGYAYVKEKLQETMGDDWEVKTTVDSKSSSGKYPDQVDVTVMTREMSLYIDLDKYENVLIVDGKYFAREDFTAIKAEIERFERKRFVDEYFRKP